ncbi:MAG: ACP S-malonyltransferase [Dehalococcoidia bacterium]|nr:ACP S-malonyltransferase [Dehalococcoidia bacterium]
MKTAYLFPGQGSQWTGMGYEIYHKYPEAKAVFDEGDEVVGFSLSQMCFDGPQVELDPIPNQQCW